MTRPMAFDNDIPFETLRKRWLTRYDKVEKETMSEMRTVLLLAAEDAQKQLVLLASKPSFSDSVMSAQLRIVLREIRALTNELFGDVLPVIKKGQQKAATAAVEAFTDTDLRYLVAALGNTDAQTAIASQRTQALTGIENAINRLERSKQPLSSRVYQSRRLANRWVERKVTTAIAKNASAKEIATTVRKSINPNVAGGVSYAAMRLGRTELNNAFHATTIALSEDRPWVEGNRWRLSQTHDAAEECICNTYADQIFSVENTPKKPHPQCRCFVTPEVEAWESFLTNLTAGQYRSWIQNAA